MAMKYLSFCRRVLVLAQTRRRDDDNTNNGADDKEYDSGCNSRSEVKGRTLEHIRIRVQGQCLYFTPTTREDVEQVESTQRVQETEHEGNQQRVPEHRAGDGPELL